MLKKLSGLLYKTKKLKPSPDRADVLFLAAARQKKIEMKAGLNILKTSIVLLLK